MEYLRLIFDAVPTGEPCGYWLELDAKRYGIRRIEHFADGALLLASVHLNAD